MHGNDPATWAAFFTAVTGAAAALVGLLFVAVSINLDNILKSTTMLPARAAETLAVLLFVVISSALALVPQDVELLGAEILVIAVPLTAITVRSQLIPTLPVYLSDLSGALWRLWDRSGDTAALEKKSTRRARPSS